MKVKKPVNVIVEIDGTEVTLVPVIAAYDGKLSISKSPTDKPVGYLMTLPVVKEDKEAET